MANPSLEWITVMNEISTVNVLIQVQVLKSKKYKFIYPGLCRFLASDQGLFKFMQDSILIKIGKVLLNSYLVSRNFELLK